MPDKEKIPDRYYVPRSFFRWTSAIEIDVGLGYFTLSGDFIGNSIGFMPVYTDIRLYNRDLPNEDPIVFDATITDANGGEEEDEG